MKINSPKIKTVTMMVIPVENKPDKLSPPRKYTPLPLRLFPEYR
jgi:hypothetical protein